MLEAAVEGTHSMGKEKSRHKRNEADGSGDGLVAAFWRNGKFERFTCADCQVIVQPTYSEVMLRDSRNNYAMFIISNDPEIAETMQQAGYDPGIFDGFQLRDLEGNTLEKISVFDSQTIN